MENKKSTGNEKMNLYENLKSVKFEVIEGDHVTVGDFWNSDCSRFKDERIYLIKRGEARMSLKEKELYLKPNRLYFIPAYSVLQGKLYSNLEHYFVHFRFTSHDGSFSSLFHLGNEIAATQEDEYLFDVLLKLIKNTIDTPQTQLHANGILQILISKFIPTINYNDENATRIDATLKYINDNITKKITVKELAQQHHLHETYFSETFKKVLGVTPQQYIINKRISYAMMLLSNSQRSINEIAAMLDFDDPMYFSRIFKKKTGFSPRDFRKKLISKEL